MWLFWITFWMMWIVSKHAVIRDLEFGGHLRLSVSLPKSQQVCIGLPKMLEFPLHGPWLGVQCIHILWNRSHNTLINISTIHIPYGQSSAKLPIVRSSRPYRSSWSSRSLRSLRSWRSSRSSMSSISWGHLGHLGHPSGLFVFPVILSSCHFSMPTNERTNKQINKQTNNIRIYRSALQKNIRNISKNTKINIKW